MMISREARNKCHIHPLEISHSEDVSTEEEGKQDRDRRDNRKNRKEDQQLDIVQEENTGNVEIEEKRMRETQKEVKGKEEDFFLQTFGGLKVVFL
jgi:hypothetical protein